MRGKSCHIGYGLYYGALQGAATTPVADLVTPELRGTAYGLFNGPPRSAFRTAAVLSFGARLTPASRGSRLV